MSSYTRVALENWLKTINVSGSCIDVGGSQNPIRGRTKTWNCDDYKILDLEQPHECKQKPDIIGDIQNIIWLDELLGGWNYSEDIYKYIGYFNNVFCLEVSEYWFDPLLALKNINQLIKDGGLLYISFHFIYPQHNPRGLDYLRYTSAGVEKLLVEAGFKILEHIPRRTEVVDLKEVWSAEKMRGWKDFDNSIIGSMVKCRKKG